MRKKAQKVGFQCISTSDRAGLGLTFGPGILAQTGPPQPAQTKDLQAHIMDSPPGLSKYSVSVRVLILTRILSPRDCPGESIL